MATKPEYRSFLRTYIGDTPLKNLLHAGHELEDTSLDLALDMAVDQYNTTPPILGTVTYQDFPSITILIQLATIQSLIMAGIVQSRNFLQFNDGGVSYLISDKAGDYQNWIGRLLEGTREHVMSYKIARNMDDGFDTIQSPYAKNWWY